MSTAISQLCLTLGPVLYNWPPPQWVDFYTRIADEAPVDRVCVGEVVCSKRIPFRAGTVTKVTERLVRGGKEVVHATLALPTTKRELRAIAEVAEAGYLVEANDMATVRLLAGRPHIIGPFLNIYNEAALTQHVALGAIRVCLPVEIPLDSVFTLAAGSAEIEVFAFGRPPLAISARCYHARAHKLPKDACQFVCENDPDGLDVNTMDGRSFLAVNGVQTLGHAVTAAINQVSDLRAAGVASLRLSPHTCDMVRVATVFRDLADKRIDTAEARYFLGQLPLPGRLADGYLRGQPGMRLLEEID